MLSKRKGDNLKENWINIKDSLYYQVSDLGRVRLVGGAAKKENGVIFHTKPKIKKHFINHSGYCLVSLKFDIGKKKSVHRLVLEAFNPVDGMDELQVNHKDGNKLNNRLDNLEWVTQSENILHAYRMGLCKPTSGAGSEGHNSKLTDKQVEEIRHRLSVGDYTSQSALGKEYGVAQSTISYIKHRKSWNI